MVSNPGQAYRYRWSTGLAAGSTMKRQMPFLSLTVGVLVAWGSDAFAQPQPHTGTMTITPVPQPGPSSARYCCTSIATPTVAASSTRASASACRPWLSSSRTSCE